MTAAPSLGRVITFYSYKGGTGRSMALANIAWMLAAAGRRVLAIDWDLEAPGLHRYFRPFLIDDELTASEGLMDLVDIYANQAIKPADDTTTTDPDWFLPYTDFSDHVVSVNFPHFRAGGKIDLLPAGKQGDRYATLVSSFNWQNFYDRLGGSGFFEVVKQRARASYDYVLIDSRTGVSDTAGICSVQMPESLVVCFTYNNQSIKGAAAVAKSAHDTHKRMVEEKLALQRSAPPAAGRLLVDDTPRPYRVFPVPMRVDDGESDRLAVRQAFAQQAFADLVSHVSAADVVSDYWRPVEVPYAVFYAYEEVLAPFKDDARDPKTMLAALLRLTRFVTDGDVVEYNLALSPQERQRYLEEFAKVGAGSPVRPAQADAPRESDEQILARKAENALATLSEAERTVAARVLLRLVRVGTDEEDSSLSPIRCALSDFNPLEKTIVGKLASYGIVTIDSRSAQAASRAEPTVALVDPRLLTSWRTLIGWIERDRPFLVWRQQLRRYMAGWERSGRDPHALLSGRLFSEADLTAVRREDELTAAELVYIDESRNAAHEAARQPTPQPLTPSPAVPVEPARGPARWWWTAIAALLIVATGAGILLWRRPPTLADVTPPASNVDPQVTVPRLIDLSSTEARTAAEALGLRVVMTDGTTEGSELEGVVVSQTPKESETITADGTIRLTVSRVAQLSVAVPRVVQQQADAAAERILAVGLNPRRTEETSELTPGTVLRQVPDPGVLVARGAAVGITVAVPPKVVIPNVVGRTRADAIQELTRLRLRANPADDEASALPPELVVSQVPSAGTAVVVGGAVRITVATGVEVPNLSGFSADAAQRAVAERGLSFDNTAQETDAATPGQVFQQQPASGTRVTRGSRVLATVAVAVPVLVPSVVGLPRQRAAAILEAAGLRAGPEPDATASGRVVERQQPAANTRVARLTPVTLFVAAPPSSVQPQPGPATPVPAPVPGPVLTPPLAGQPAGPAAVPPVQPGVVQPGVVQPPAQSGGGAPAGPVAIPAQPLLPPWLLSLLVAVAAIAASTYRLWWPGSSPPPPPIQTTSPATPPPAVDVRPELGDATMRLEVSGRSLISMDVRVRVGQGGSEQVLSLEDGALVLEERRLYE